MGRPPHPCIHQSTPATAPSHKCTPTIVVKVALGSNGAHAPPSHLAILLLTTVVLLTVSWSSLRMFTIASPPSPLLAPAPPIPIKQSIRDLYCRHVGQRGNHLENQSQLTFPISSFTLSMSSAPKVLGMVGGTRQLGSSMEASTCKILMIIHTLKSLFLSKP